MHRSHLSILLYPYPLDDHRPGNLGEPDDPDPVN